MNSVDTITATRNKDLSSPTPKNLPERWTGIRRYLTFGFAGGLSALSLGVAIQYGASIGAATGTATSVLLIALGVLTEAGKALGFYNTAASLRSRSFLASVGWSAVALSCLAYSVAADLHVSASSRSDATAQRAQVIQAVKDARFDRETASVALRSIESQASFNQRIEKLLATKGANRCTLIDGPISRTTCSAVAELKAEKVAASKRTAELEAKIAKADTIIVAQTCKATGIADASSATLATLFSKFGWSVQVRDVALVLVFLPVLIIEFCGSLAWLLAGAVQGPVIVSTRAIDLDPTQHEEKLENTGVDSDSDDLGHDIGNCVHEVVPLIPRRGRKVSDRDDIAARVMDTLSECGGEFAGGVRKLAEQIGGRKSTVHNAVRELVEAGALIQGRGSLKLA